MPRKPKHPEKQMKTTKCDVCSCETDDPVSTEIDISLSPKFIDVCPDCIEKMGYKRTMIQNTTDMVSLIVRAMRFMVR